MANTVERGLVNKSSLTAIGDAIRAKNGGTTKYKPSEMAAAISNLKTGDFTVATSDKFNFKVVQSANQIITSTPTGKAMNNSDGTVSVALTDTTTISPNTNYIPGAVQRSYDDSTHTYTVTATNAEPIDGLVQDGWSVVYQKGDMTDDLFYTQSDFSGTRMDTSHLQGNILIGGMTEPVVESPGRHAYRYPNETDKITKYKNSYVIDMSNHVTNDDSTGISTCANLTEVSMVNLREANQIILCYGCKNLVSVDLPNLTTVGRSFLANCSNLTHIEMPSLVTASDTYGYNMFKYDYKLRSIEMPKLQTGLIADTNASSDDSMDFVDAGFIDPLNIDVNVRNFSRVIVLRNTSVPTAIAQSSREDPTLYIVPSVLVDIYKTKIRSMDYVTALEKSPFADGKTVCGNNMKTVYQSRSEIWLGEGTSMVWHARSDKWVYDTYYPQSDDNSGDQAVPSVANVMRAPEITDRSFRFFSKLTKEQGYTIPT